MMFGHGCVRSVHCSRINAESFVSIVVRASHSSTSFVPRPHINMFIVHRVHVYCDNIRSTRLCVCECISLCIKIFIRDGQRLGHGVADAHDQLNVKCGPRPTDPTDGERTKSAFSLRRACVLYVFEQIYGRSAVRSSSSSSSNHIECGPSQSSSQPSSRCHRISAIWRSSHHRVAPMPMICCLFT